MTICLKNRSLLSLMNHSKEEIVYLLDLSSELKQAKRTGNQKQTLKGKCIALIFEKTSTRTRCAFEVAAYDLGANVTYIDPNLSQIGHKESIKDTARVLGRMYDAIEYRGSSQETVQTLAQFANVPVFNGLTDEFHPTQILADALTMREHCIKPLNKVSFVYIGDAHNNMGRSLLLLGAKLGMDVRICSPNALQPKENFIQQCQIFAMESDANITVTDNIDHAIKNVDFIYTDVWVSLGEPMNTWKERINLLLPYQVTSELMKHTENPHTKFMHCLPAFHNTETIIGYEIAQQYPQLKEGIEVTESVFESPANISFEQAENRMHTIKAVLHACLG